LLRRLTLQTIDNLWVEHLEVMNYTRSSVNLRAYGQRDPLVEYKKEGVRLFKEMQEALFDRLLDILPRLQPVVVEKEEVEMKQKSEQAQKTAGDDKKTKKEPVRKAELPNRNESVTITDGKETQTLKYKKAEALLRSGWKLVK